MTNAIPPPSIPANAPRDRLARDALFCVTTLLYKIARADGEVTDEELDRIQHLLDNKFEVQPEDQEEIRALMRHWGTDFDFFDLVRRFRDNLARLVDPERADRAYRSAIEMMFMVAASDGEIHPREERLANAAAIVLGISSSAFGRLRATYATVAPDAPLLEDVPMAETAELDLASASDDEKTRHYLRVLGLTETAEKDALRTAYHDAVRKYHPDHVQHLGDELQALAELKTREINAAYEWLRGREPGEGV